MSATINIQEPVRTETTVINAVRFVCPRCGDDRDGIHAHGVAGDTWVECHDCAYRCDSGVLGIPTETTLNEWYSQAMRHGRTAIRCADGTPACSYLAIVWCRRLAPELTMAGKLAYLNRVARPLAGTLTDNQRSVLLQLGVALKLPAPHLNAALAAV
jgi:hypothetical protein